MRLFPRLLVLTLLLAVAPALADLPKSGTYELAISVNPGLEHVNCLVKLDAKEGGVTATVISGLPPAIRAPQVKSATLEGDTLRFVLKKRFGKDAYADMVFEGRVGKPGEKILGSIVYNAISSGKQPAPPQKASMTPTDKTTIERPYQPRQLDMPEPYRKAEELMMKASSLGMQASQAKDAEQKAKLQKDLDDALKEAEVGRLKLYQEVIEKHPDTHAAASAATFLINGSVWAMRGAGTRIVIPEAAQRGEPAEQVAKWAEIVANDAARYGPSFQWDTTTRLAERLRKHKPYAAIAVKYATQAEKLLGPKATAEQRLRVLESLAAALRNADKTAEADAVDRRIAELQKQRDK
jgi:hypothetical protein